VLPISRSWMRRMEADVSNGLSAEAAVEKRAVAARSRLGRRGTPICATACMNLDESVETACCGF